MPDLFPNDVMYDAMAVFDQQTGEPVASLRGQNGIVVLRGTDVAIDLLDINRLPLAQPITVSELGFLPTFIDPEGVASNGAIRLLDFVSGPSRMPINSPRGIEQSAAASRVAAEEARDAARAAAQDVGQEVAVAQQAATVAVDAADRATSIVVANADVAVATLLSGPTSSTAQAASALIARDLGSSEIARAARLPTNVRSEWLGYNATAPDTFGGFEYVAYVRDDLHPVVAQHNLRTGAWTVTDVAPIFGNIASDGHNYFRVIVDGAGFVHVWGNMHAEPLKYAVSTAPNSIAAFTAKAAMVGTHEDKVTYPSPLRRESTGDLFFSYRNGTSGGGAVYLNRYSVATKTWHRIGVLVDGTDTDEGVYTSEILLDHNEVMHLAYCFRTSDSPNTNHDVCYVRSTDFGQTWQSATGAPVSTPLTPASSPIVFPTALTGSGLLNSPTLSVDSTGVVHISFLLFDSAGKTNVYHLWFAGGQWRGEFVTNSTYRMPLDGGGVISSRTARPGVVSSGPNTYILWRSMDDGKAGTIRAIDVTTPGAPFEFSVANIDVGYAEFNIFNVDAARTGTLKLVVTPQPLGGVAGSPVTNWQSQWGIILTLDLTRLRLLGAIQSGRPSMRDVASFVLPAGANSKATTFTNVPEIPPIFADPEWAPRVTLVKLTGRFAQSAGTSTWGIRQQDHTGGNGRLRGETPALGSGTGLSGFRVPATLDGSLMPSGGWLSVQAKTSDATNGTTESLLKVTVSQMINGDGTFVQ